MPPTSAAVVPPAIRRNRWAHLTCVYELYARIARAPAPRASPRCERLVDRPRQLADLERLVHHPGGAERLLAADDRHDPVEADDVGAELHRDVDAAQRRDQLLDGVTGQLERHRDQRDQIAFVVDEEDPRHRDGQWWGFGSTNQK